MIRILFLFILFIFIFGCSFNKNSKFWTSSKNIDLDNNEFTEKIIVKESAISKELNPNIRIIFKSNFSLTGKFLLKKIIFSLAFVISSNFFYS